MFVKIIDCSMKRMQLRWSADNCRVCSTCKVNDVMSTKGWSLNALQKPSGLHVCVTLQMANTVGVFISELSEAVSYVKGNPRGLDDGMATIYGAAAKMPDRGIVRDLLVSYMDTAC